MPGPSGVRRQADRLGEASTSRATGGSSLPSGAQVPKWLKLSESLHIIDRWPQCAISLDISDTRYEW